MNNEEKHVCYYCGQEASYQLKNGNWCCKQNARSCPSIRNKVSKKAKEKWKELKQKGITNRNEIKKIKNLGIEGICYYCGKPAQYKLKNGRWCCCKNYQSCPELKNKNSKKQKQRYIKGNGGFSKRNKLIRKNLINIWNKGLTKYTDERIAKGAKKLKEKYDNGLKIWCYGKKLSQEMKQKISIGMKKAHKQKRAHNIGQCRRNNKPSYPQLFFMKVIENQFQNKNYQRQYPFFRFSIDFAWVDKKLAIEIDGQQHERFEEIKNRDKIKNELLIKNGWKFLRIKWKNMYNNSKFWIKKAKYFIDNN